MRNICIFTGTRADYSRLFSLLRAVEDHSELQLQLIVSGMHLIEKHGLTVNQIIEDGFKVDREIYSIIEGENLETMTKSVGLVVTEMATALHHLKPDVLVVHGDRYEVLGAAVAGSLMNIPLAHLQGGEVTGSIDESLRHAITKLSHLHFCSNENARDRLIRLGENPESVFNVGCPMVDKILQIDSLPKEKIFSDPLISPKDDIISYDLDAQYLLIVFHPVTSEIGKNSEYTINLIEAIKKIDMQAIWLWPNADAGAREIVNSIKTYDGFFQKNTKIGFYRSLPVDLFINILKQAACIVGNSSVGLREACYFGTPVVNIGKRQDGRVRPANVIDVEPETEAVYNAIKKQCSNGPYPTEKIYGDGSAGQKIAHCLATLPIPSTQKKIFY